MHASKQVEATLSKASERLNAVNMGCALHEFLVTVVDAVVAVKAHIHQPIVATPAIGVDHRSRVNFTSDDALQVLFRATRHDFRVHLAAAFEQA